MNRIRKWAEDQGATEHKSTSGFTIAICYDGTDFVEYSKCQNSTDALVAVATKMMDDLGSGYVMDEAYLRFVALGNVLFSFYKDPEE